jgi:hypothetical protein
VNKSHFTELKGVKTIEKEPFPKSPASPQLWIFIKEYSQGDNKIEKSMKPVRQQKVKNIKSDEKQRKKKKSKENRKSGLSTDSGYPLILLRNPLRKRQIIPDSNKVPLFLIHRNVSNWG